MINMSLLLGLLTIILGVHGTLYNPIKDRMLSDMMIRDIIDRMSNELVDAADSYLEYQDNIHMTNEYDKAKEYPVEMPVDYDGIETLNPNPSIRDQEYLQHSTLLANQRLNDNNDSRYKIQLAGLKGIKEDKTKNPLPAYCTPPNPCPIGYSGKDNCSEDFENTAEYSRDYQSAQDCMCDTEHMVDCPSVGENVQDGGLSNRIINSELNQIVEHLQNANPFLRGEKLPIAAKKGIDVISY